MTIHQYFLDSTEDNEHEYDMQDFAEFHAVIFGGNGVSNTENREDPLDDFAYEAKDGMEGELGSGYAVANGMMMASTSPITLEHDTADPDDDRIDRVVIQFNTDPDKAEFKPTILKGDPSSDPKPPELTRDSHRYELSVAQVKVQADKASIDDDDITDERSDLDVGGYIPLDNLMRGVQVDEHGLTTMPNQSYVEVNSTTSNDNITIKDRENIIIPLDEIERDQQKEIYDEDEGIFKPKTDGTYLITAHIAFDEGVLEVDESDVQIKYYIDGDYTGMLVARVPAGKKDNIFNGVNTHYMEKGQELQVKIEVKHAPDGLETRNHRITIAKLN